MRSGIARFLRYAVMTAGILALGAFLWLWRMGFPKPILQAIETHAVFRGMNPRIGKVRLLPSGAVRLEDVVFHPAADWGLQKIRSERVTLRISYAELVRGKIAIRKISLDEAAVFASPSAESPDRPLSLERLSGQLEFHPKQWDLRVAGRLAGRTDLLLRGSWLRETAPDPMPQPFPDSPAPDAVKPSAEDLRKAIRAAWETFRKASSGPIRSVLDHLTVPQADIRFQAWMDPVAGPAGKASIRLRQASLMGMAVDELETTGSWRGPRMDPLMIRVQSAGSEMRVEGWAHFGDRTLSLEGRGNLDIRQILLLLQTWLPWPDRLPPDPVLAGPVGLRFATGTVPWSQAWQQISGRVELDRPFQLWGVTGTQLQTDARIEDGWIRFENIHIGTGTLERPGVVTGQFNYHPASRRFDGDADAHMDPSVALGFLRPEEMIYIAAIQAPESYPRARGRFAGQFGDVSQLVVTARVEGRNVYYSGLFLREANFELSVVRQTARFSNLHIRMSDGELNGDVLQDFRNDRAEFRLVSSLNPGAIARILGPQAHRFIQMFRFEGPVHIAGEGRVRYQAPVSGDFSLRFLAEAAGMDWAMADSIEARVDMRDRELTFSDIQSRFHGGRIEGRAMFLLPATEDESVRYDFTGTLQDAKLDGVLLALAPDSDDKFQGTLSAALSFRGDIGEGHGPSVTGDGWVRVRDGQLTSLRIFGGLSQALSNIRPGLGYLTQTGLSTSFQIRDSRIFTDNMKITGPILSLQARGHIGFDQRLNYVIQAQLLRRGLAADMLRFLTFPVTKLLELDLEGTLQNPVWKSRNIPR